CSPMTRITWPAPGHGRFRGLATPTTDRLASKVSRAPARSGETSRTRLPASRGADSLARDGLRRNGLDVFTETLSGHRSRRAGGGARGHRAVVPVRRVQRRDI